MRSKKVSRRISRPFVGETKPKLRLLCIHVIFALAFLAMLTSCSGPEERTQAGSHEKTLGIKNEFVPDLVMQNFELLELPAEMNAASSIRVSDQGAVSFMIDQDIFVWTEKHQNVNLGIAKLIEIHRLKKNGKIKTITNTDGIRRRSRERDVYFVEMNSQGRLAGWSVLPLIRNRMGTRLDDGALDSWAYELNKKDNRFSLVSWTPDFAAQLRAMNDEGQSIGEVYEDVGKSKIYSLNSEGSNQMLFAPSALGCNKFHIVDFNNDEKILADFEDSQGKKVGALFEKSGSFKELSTGKEFSFFRMNNLSEIAGWDKVEDRVAATVWSKNSVLRLGTLGGIESAAIDINDDGYVVGWSDTQNEKIRGFLWRNDIGTVDLNELPGNESWPPGIEITSPVAISNHGWIASKARNGKRPIYVLIRPK